MRDIKSSVGDTNQVFQFIVNFVSQAKCPSHRVRTGPGKPGKSWNFILAFSRTGKSWKVLEIC